MRKNSADDWPIDRALSVTAAAERLGLSRSTVDRMRRAGEIRSIKIRKRVIIPMSEVERLLNRGK